MPVVKAFTTAFAAAVAVTLAACAGDPNASVSNFAANSTTGAVAGAATGGVLGSAIGENLDERDRRRAFAAEMQALEYGEPGTPIGWRGDTAGRHGTVIPGAYYETRGTRCRAYTHAIYIDGKPQTARSTACRNADGSWSPVG
jgi:surface antigen